MKIRNGFVSNSSSSSFVVNLERPIGAYSLEEFMVDYEITQYPEMARRLYLDLNNNATEMESILTDMENTVSLDINASYNILSYDEQKEIEEELHKIIKEKIKEKFNIEDDIGTKYVVEYSDNDGEFFSEMEHDFMPYFKGTIARISHH